MKKHHLLSFIDDKQWQHFFHLSWLWPPTLLVSFALLAFFTTKVIDDELQFMHEGLNRVENSNRGIYALTYQISQSSTKVQSNKVNELKDIRSDLLTLENNLEKMNLNKSTGVFYSKAFHALYFNDEWRFDEVMSHYLHLTHKWLSEYENKNVKSYTILAKEIASHHRKFRRVEKILIPLVENEIDKIRNYSHSVKIIILLLFALILCFVFFMFYVPTKKSLSSVSKEIYSYKIANEYLESRGGVFYWELGLEDMSLIRSSLLTGQLSGVQSEDHLSLEDELSYFSPEDREKFMTALDKAIHNKEFFDIEINVTSSNNKKYWLYYELQYEEDGERILGTVKDITRLRNLEDKFDRLFDNIPLPLILIDGELIVNINDKALEYLAIKEKDELIDGHFCQLFSLEQGKGEDIISVINGLTHNVDVSKESVNRSFIFKHGTRGAIECMTEYFSLATNHGNRYVLSLIDDSSRLNLERRLLDVNRNRLNERKRKVEITAHYHATLHDMLEKLNTFYPHQSELKDLYGSIDRLWLESLTFDVSTTQHLMLTEDKKFIGELNRVIMKQYFGTKRKIDLNYNLHDGDCAQYYWLDVEKVKSLVELLVNFTLAQSDESACSIDFNFNHISDKVASFGFKFVDHNGLGDFSKKNIKESSMVKPIGEIVEHMQGFLKQRVEDNGTIITTFEVDIERSSNSYALNNDKVYAGEINSVRDHEKRRQLTEQDLWDHLGFDHSLVRTLLKDFMSYYPVCIADMLEAIRDKDTETLYRHTADLYSLVSYFPYFYCIESVVLIKKYAQFQNFRLAEQELSFLITELKKLEYSVDNILLNIHEVA